MWPFEDPPMYVDKNGEGSGPPKPIRRMCWSLGAHPSYVDPTQPSPGLPSVVLEIMNPELNLLAPLALGDHLPLNPPPGAKQYRLWLSPVSSLAGDTIGVEAVVMGYDIPAEGAIPAGALFVAPKWALVGTRPIPAAAFKATLLVTFE